MKHHRDTLTDLGLDGCFIDFLTPPPQNKKINKIKNFLYLE